MLPTLLFKIFATTILPPAGTACTVTPAGSLFGLLKPWYYYITSGRFDTTGNCIPSIDLINHSNQIWLIGLALFDDLLAIAGFAAVAMVIFGGFRFITSGGSSEQAKSARGTVINALIGLVIVSVATVLVSFLSGYLSQ